MYQCIHESFIREYSMECLLSYIEFDQFQKFIIKTANTVLRKHALVQ